MLKKLIKKILFFFKRLFSPSMRDWIISREIEPFSNQFGFDYGTPIDRFYTNLFLQKNRHYIQGSICEIAENTYTKNFGTNITNSSILFINSSNPHATLIGDLTKHDTLPKDYFDCFICTVTLNFIFDYKKAIEGIYQTLKGGGGCTHYRCRINTN